MAQGSPLKPMDENPCSEVLRTYASIVESDWRGRYGGLHKATEINRACAEALRFHADALAKGELS